MYSTITVTSKTTYFFPTTINCMLLVHFSAELVNVASNKDARFPRKQLSFRCLSRTQYRDVSKSPPLEFLALWGFFRKICHFTKSPPFDFSCVSISKKTQGNQFLECLTLWLFVKSFSINLGIFYCFHQKKSKKACSTMQVTNFFIKVFLKTQ